MKIRHIPFGILLLMTLSSEAQNISSSFTSSVSETDRLTLVRSSIPLTDWHEKSFWPQYNDYRERIHNLSLQTYQSLDNLGRSTRNTPNAFEIGTEMITNRLNELAVRKQSYTGISRDHNGIVALKFLQTEFTFDLVESSRVYDETPLKNYRFRSASLSSAQYNTVKYNLLSKALALSPQEAVVFFPLYTRYEEERMNTMGAEYDLYGQFAGDASDLTPGLAKHQGANLLMLMEREIRLKEKYFNEINASIGPTVATRFLAWEDYFSVGCKLNVWAAEQ
jgi:hypothetical protein